MNMTRYIFSFKLVIFFALLSPLVAGAPNSSAGVKCPCPFKLMHDAAIAQAAALGLTATVDTCYEDSTGIIGLAGFNYPPCYTEIDLLDLMSAPRCYYVFACDLTGTNPADTGYFTIYLSLYINDQEVKACRSALIAIANNDGVHQCQQVP